MSASSVLLLCFSKTNLWTSDVDVVGPTWTVLADPICAKELKILIFVISWPGWGKTGSTKYVLPVSNPTSASPSGRYVTASPWINFIFLPILKLIKLYRSFKGLKPSNPVAVPPVRVSSTISVVIS